MCTSTCIYMPLRSIISKAFWFLAQTLFSILTVPNIGLYPRYAKINRPCPSLRVHNWSKKGKETSFNYVIRVQCGQGCKKYKRSGERTAKQLYVFPELPGEYLKFLTIFSTLFGCIGSIFYIVHKNVSHNYTCIVFALLLKYSILWRT